MKIFDLFSKKKRIKKKKREIRHKLRALRHSTTDSERAIASKIVFEKIEQLDEFITSENIMIYWSTSTELPTHDFIKKWCNKKNILLPAIRGRYIELKPFVSEEDFRVGKFGIKEPQTETFNDNIDLVITPAIAFDYNRNRIGQGGGYYDRFLSNISAIKIGVGYDFQIINKVPTREHDTTMDKVITPNNSI